MLRVIDAIGRLAGYAAAVMIVGIAVLVLTEITCRNVFNISLTFAWDYSAYMMAGAIFCGAAFTLRTGGHVRVSLLTHNVPGWMARGIDWIATLFGLAMSAYASYALVLFAWQSFVTGRTSPTIDATPLVYPQGVIAFGACLLTLQLLARLIRLGLGEAPEDTAAKEAYGVE
ncbi:MAG: TRAP transporter small permease [Alphaproteobacteria bacterium]|nr:TRAP transporter small permease [Alphaproteobacteria bacterium]MCB9930832.1 TRAP transporter small permease [Alphaproteobacteria bacterium]